MFDQVKNKNLDLESCGMSDFHRSGKTYSATEHTLARR